MYNNLNKTFESPVCDVKIGYCTSMDINHLNQSSLQFIQWHSRVSDLQRCFHSTDFDDVNEKSVVPSNEFMIASLISAVSWPYPYRFYDSPAQDYLLRGLHYDDDNYVFLGHAFSFLWQGRICMAQRVLPTSAELMFSGRLKGSIIKVADIVKFERSKRTTTA